MSRIEVRKTYKLFIGGAFPRSESGRTFEVRDSRGNFVANAALASRKDARDAVSAARSAVKPWMTRTAYNRGQVLYRVAEVLEGRREQFVQSVRLSEGITERKASAQVDEAIDRWVWFAGWADKMAQVVGNANQVAGSFFNLSTPEPTGVVAIAAPHDDSLFNLVELIAPAIVSGNSVVVVSPNPIVAIELAEVFATSDVPNGVVNVLTGQFVEIMPWLAEHGDVNGLDLAGIADQELARELEADGAETLKRVVRPGKIDGYRRMVNWLEIKTVWHPIGV